MSTVNPISGSVGAGGANRPPDVKIAQMLLNNWLRKTGNQPLKVDGVVGPKTIKGISDYQRGRGLVVDGRMDPLGPTITTLVSLQIQLLRDGASRQFLEMTKYGLSNIQVFKSSALSVDLNEMLNIYLLAVKKG